MNKSIALLKPIFLLINVAIQQLVLLTHKTMQATATLQHFPDTSPQSQHRSKSKSNEFLSFNGTSQALFQLHKNSTLLLLSETLNCIDLLFGADISIHEKELDGTIQEFLVWDPTLEARLQLSQISKHLDQLANRINSKSCRVLLTGDLNAGKSTVTNTLLGRNIVPTDQQPCTVSFIQIMDSSSFDILEQMHAIPDRELYDLTDPTTFTTFPIARLADVQEQSYELINVYCKTTSPILNNGILDVCLIDSPGLNIDSIKTCELLKSQWDADVILFLLNAENHLTLSVIEYLMVGSSVSGTGMQRKDLPFYSCQ